MIDYPLLAKDRELSADEAHEVLEAGEFCVVSTVDADGMPYGVPLSYVMLDGALCFHTTNKAGHKLDNFARDGRACVTVATEVEACYEDDFFTTRFASVIARGRVRRMEDGAAMRKVLVALCMKYLPEYKDKIGEGIAREIDDTAIWAVDLEEVRGKGARRLPR